MSIPNEEDLKRLPLRAIVAFAARCARRVRPLYRIPDSSPDREVHERSIDHAIEITESVARGVDLTREAEVDQDITRPAINPSDENLASEAVRAAAAEIQLAGEAAAKAMHAAIGATAIARSPDVSTLFIADAVAGNAAAAAKFASKVVAGVSHNAQQDYESRATSDYEILLERRLGEFPNLGQPINPSESGPLGPLWPDREPKWFRTVAIRSVRSMAKRRTSSDPGFLVQAMSQPDTPDYVVVELSKDRPLGVGPKAFAAPLPGTESDAASLNEILASFGVVTVRPHFPAVETPARARPSTALPVMGLEEGVVPEAFADAFKNFVQVILPKDSPNSQKLATRLKKTNAVRDAYVAPRPVPAVVTPLAAAPEGKAPGSRNFEPSQGYLHSPPNGIGAMAVWPVPGGDGKGVKICDIEGAWNLKHEDLPKGIRLLGGKMIPNLGWRNHGTAVLGEMVSLPGVVGTVGIAHGATAVVHSAVINGVFNTAGAISAAAAKLSAGDVILIELQGTGPNGKYVAMQYWRAEFLAIQAAVAKGIVVVEAAGNGDEDYNAPVFQGTGLQTDSGAIVVGAGVPPTNYFDYFGFGAGKPGYSEIGTPRSRIWFSNYGKIVNVQGWGWHVTTLGYGDLQGRARENVWYTLRFSGTSSASPIVAAAAACIQGRATVLKGSPLTPSDLRDVLIKSGTPQEPGPGVPLSQHIGPLPDLSRAFARM
ncbi:MAG: S8 family serine peptidase, partial [Isosphaeraceae bacterium]